MPTIHAVRAFNRFYTRQIGVLREGLLKSPFSLAEVRVLYEIAHRQQPSATELCKQLGLDPGYLSRILRGFEKRGLVRKSAVPQRWPPEPAGIDSARPENFRHPGRPPERRKSPPCCRPSRPRSRRDWCRPCAPSKVCSVAGPEPQDPYILRSHQPGDMGWVVHRHGALYAQEYGYDERFEALVAEIAAKFIQHFDPKRERCWMAEKDGGIVGSVFLVKKSKTVAKLRLLLVEPSARGLGIGKRLVGECLRFARQAGYRKIVLWTQSELPAARHIYQQAGFRLMEEKPHRDWGRDDLVSEIWELTL